MTKMRINQSRIKTYRQCPKLYKWIYVDNLVSQGPKKHYLQIGDITHKMLHLHDKGELTVEHLTNLEPLIQELYPDNDLDLTQTVLHEIVRLLQAYFATKFDDTITILPGETIMEIDMNFIEPQLELTYVCRPDGWARTSDNRLWRLERKTAGKMDSHYLNGLRSGIQGSLYDYTSEKVLGEKIHGTFYEILVKTKEVQIARNRVSIDRSAIERSLGTVKGVVADIQRGNFYPDAGSCYLFNDQCTHLTLCKHDSPQTRTSFYKERPYDYVDAPTDETKKLHI